MIVNPPISLEPEAVTDRGIISISFLIVGETGSKMCCNEANGCVCVIEPDRNSAFVSSHSGKSCLFDTAFNIFDVMESRSLNEDAQCGTHELATSQQNVFLIIRSVVVPIQSTLYRSLPQLLSGRITVHNLLWVKFDDFLEADRNNFGLSFAKFGGAKPRRQVLVDTVGLSVQVESSD